MEIAKKFREAKKKGDPNNKFTKHLINIEKKAIKEEYKNETLNNYFHALNKNKKDKAIEILTVYLKQDEHIYTIRDDKKEKEVYIYNKGIYKNNGITFLQEKLRELLGKNYSNYLFNKCMERIIVDSYTEQKEFFKEPPIYFIPLQNGIFDTRTKGIIKFDPNLHFFNKLNFDYNPNVKSEKINKFIAEIIQKEDIPIIQELFGFMLIRDYFLEKAFMFNGEGRNGKGKLLSLIKFFVGAENCSALSIDQIENKDFSRANLHKKLANISGDLSKKALSTTGNFKNATGRDLISADRKFLSHLNFVNYAKMIFACNEIPITYDNTLAFFNRWIVIDFIYTFLTQEEIDKLEDKTNVKLQNPDILSEILDKDELPGLFNWALEGLYRILDNKSFSYSKSTEETKQLWTRKSNSLHAFIEEFFNIDYNTYITKQGLRDFYHLFCRTYKLPVMSDNQISRVLKDNFSISTEKLTHKSNRTYCWVGLTPVQPVQHGHPFSTYIQNTLFFHIGKKSMDKLDTLDTQQEIQEELIE